MKNWKKALMLLMMFCLMAGQCIAVQAAAKSSAKLVLNKTSYTLKKGKSVQLKVTKNKLGKKKKVVWSSSNEKVATVSAKGKVKGNKNGKATITAKVEGTKVKAICKIVVGTPVQKVKLNTKSVQLEVGQQFQLKSNVSPKKPTNKNVIYKSSKKSVASVSKKGMVRALRKGTTKITAVAADGTGKSAACTVTVKNKSIVISDIVLNASNLSLTPGQEARLSAKINPGNATDKTLDWSSTDGRVVTVNNGTVKAVGEGNAIVKVTSKNGKSANCSIKVSYKDRVSNQTELNQALTSKMVSNIIYTSNAAGKVMIAEGDYSAKTLEINAPNADVENKGQFKTVTINAIAENTYEEHSGNVIYFNAPKGRIVVGENGAATINLSSKGNQSFDLENNGYVNEINVPGKTVLKVAGSNRVPITLGVGAADSSITTSTELQIDAKAKWDMVVLPGGENTKAIVDNNSCLPSVAGVGRIPVTVSDSNDIINITAEMRDDLGIDQVVEVSGNVQEYYLTEDAGQEETTAENGDSSDIQQPSKRAEHTNCAQAKVTILPYSNANSGMNDTNYQDFIDGTNRTAETDVDGNFVMEDVKIGNYWMVVEKEAYGVVVKNVMITSNDFHTYTCSNTSLLSDEITGCENAPAISGVIIDSLTGNSVNVSGLQVKLRAGFGNVIGEVLQTAQTDEEGKYSFTNVAAGAYSVEVLDLRQNLGEDAIRYNPSYVDIVVASGYLAADNYNCQIDQKMLDFTGRGRVQFTLTWGTEESGASADIDSHLVGPKKNGEGEFHIYYGNPGYYHYDDVQDVKMADLDVDDTTWEGPEHTTIYEETDGIYRFYIHNYSERDVNNSQMLAKSFVQVRVTIGTNSHTFYCPNGTGNLWYVCDYDSRTHRIIPKNKVSNFLIDESHIGISEEEYERICLEKLKESTNYKLKSLKETLLKFSDNTAKSALADELAEFEDRIASADKVDVFAQISSDLKQLEEKLDTILCNPSVAADNLEAYNFDVVYGYDDDENVISAQTVVNCEILFGDTLMNLKAESYRDGYTLSVEATEDAGYAYVIHVLDTESGLAYDIKVKVLANQAAVNVSNKIQECRKLMSPFENTEALLADRAQIDGIVVGDINDEQAYDEAMNKLREIRDKYYYDLSKFDIDTVRAESGLSDWWTNTVDENDENGNWLKTNKVLIVERYEEVTDEEILSKLSITFEKQQDDEGQPEEVSYEITDSDNDKYPKMIKVTDGQYTKKIYIKVIEW